MRSPWLFLAPLAAPLLFISPAEAAILPACCVTEGETHPGDPPHPENPSPFFAGAKVRNPEERALEATAEAPIPVEAPLADAIGIPVEEPTEAVEPVREPERVRIVEPPPLRVDADARPMPDGLIYGPPCCQVEGETHPPDPRDPEDTPPFLVGAKVRSGDERALKAAGEVQIPAQAPRVDAIGIPLEERPGVSEPAHVPVSAGNRPAFVAPGRWLRAMQANAELITALFVILLAIGFWLLRRRRWPRLEPEPFAVPVTRPPLPETLLASNAAPATLFEPVTAPAVKAAPERELEPA